MSSKPGKYIQVLKTLKTGRFKPLPKKRLDTVENMEQMRDNLWSMFNMKYTETQMRQFHETKKWPFGASVADYAWTESVQDAFYKHPYHAKLVKRIQGRKDLTWGMWVLNTEPANYKEVREYISPKKSKMNDLMRSLQKAYPDGLIDSCWDYDKEEPGRRSFSEAWDDPLALFIVNYAWMLVEQGEGISLKDMKKDVAGLLRNIQETLFDIEEKLKK
jgi:hypothetical protein